MTSIVRALIYCAALVAAMLAFGFVIFATSVMRGALGGAETADGIVVLTGGDNRIVEGARLLSEGRGKRLLISGVNRRTTRESVQRISRLEVRAFNCCVDLGYEALDTVGNADETRTWAKANGYETLIVVTSSYHMPRSLAELALAMPGTKLVPHAVTPRNFPDSGWWLNVHTTRVLLSEYLKYLPAVARLNAQRLMGWNTDRPIAIAEPNIADR